MFGILGVTLLKSIRDRCIRVTQLHKKTLLSKGVNFIMIWLLTEDPFKQKCNSKQ